MKMKIHISPLASWAMAGAHALRSAPSPPPLCRARPLLSPFPPPLSEGARTGTRRRTIDTPALYSAVPGGSDLEAGAVDAEIESAPAPSPARPNAVPSSFLRAVDSFGLNLKPWAVRAHEKSRAYRPSALTRNADVNGANATSDAATMASAAGNWTKSVLCRIQAHCLWILYIFYRGYRGFFVILPAVFREVYRQLDESDVVVDAYGDDGRAEGSAAPAAAASQPPTRWRTSLTISVLSLVLTLSYVVSGAFRVLGKFIKTFTNTTSVESSFEAAAEEVAANEDKLRRHVR